MDFALSAEEKALAEALSQNLARVCSTARIRVWEAGCQFVNIEPALSERIVQYIFAQQRALARMHRS